MSLNHALKSIVASLRNHIQTGTLDAHAVQTVTTELAKHRYTYDVTLFPPLPSNYQWPVPTLATAESLAEALLWKMGKWKIYKSFVAHYSSTSSMPKNTDVVFYAFAKHLQNHAKPIYDQHALRALWAVDAKLTAQQVKTCRNLLVKRDGTWKSIITGSQTSAGYDLYVERIATLEKGGASPEDLDKMLMPLGQALKANTANISEFVELAACAK